MKKFINKIARHVLVVTLMISVLMPHVANAQLAVTAPILEAQTITDYIGRLLKVTFRNVAVVGAVNISQQIARDAAESIATWIATGAPGQNPLAYMKSPGDYVKDHTEQALGNILDQMSEDFANASLLCVANPLAPLGVLAGLYDAFNSAANTVPFNNKGQNVSGLSTGTLGKCDVGSITVSYKSLMNELSSEQLLDRFSTALTGGGSEVSSIVEAQMQALASLVREQNRAELERTATKTHADLTSKISGEVLQPSSQVEEDAALNSTKFQMEQEARTLGGVLASGAEAIPAIFATTLANSLSKKLIARLKQGKGTIPSSKEINLANIFGAGKSIGANGPGSIYTDVKTAVITESELDLLTSFSACPDKFAQPDNCVLDSKFESAIRAASAGKALTVREAIDQGKLDGNWELVPPSQTARNEDRLCFKSAYCYSNLTKLRKARIIPIGWEIAAATADGTGKVTLGNVVNAFNNCNAANERDDEHPFCHLIDPNWVLKMPEQICRAKVYGALPENELSANRQEVCADQASCLEEDANGQCTGAYGYCMKERNTFRFDAESCPAQFAGCRTFNNKQFGQISLIESTVDSSVCTDKNVGCLGYSVDYQLDGQFDLSKPKAYLNEKATQCEAQYAGCSEVQNAASGQTQFVRIAPQSLGCKGLSTDPVQCNQYAKACTADEVGCELYESVGSSDPEIPGVATFASKNANGQIVDWNDECSSECVGYSSYYQAPTQTEPVAAAAVAFIPKSAQACTQDMVGCDVYENIDSAVKGGGSSSYFSQIQKCTDPAIEQNHKIFYSWEGSDQSGYQLRQHDLTIAATGATQGLPVYDASSGELPQLNALCNADVYKTRVGADGKPDPSFDSDCRELFDDKGAASYRLMSRTIVSSAACTAFKKADSNQENCSASRGTFDGATGTCAYSILPIGSTSCKEEFVGCRAYNGAAALSPKKILDEEFNSIASWTGGDLSSEGITVGDTVLRIAGASASSELSISQNKTYSIAFWAKGAGSLNVAFTTTKNSPGSITLNSAPLALSPEWKQFQVSTAVAPWTDVAAKIVFEKTSGSGLVYVENLVVKEQADIQYVIKDSWETPLMCDPNPNDTLPGPALNCQEYKPKSDSKKTNVYLTGFTGLCRPAVAGCQKFVNTYNTAQVTEKEADFGAVKRTIPADEFVYAVATNAAFCPADKKGCTAVGVTANGKTETAYRMYNPDNAEITCKQSEEWCQAFDVAGVNGQQRYFKYPDQDKRCEYRENKEVSGVTYTGWFKEGTNNPCYEGFVSGGNTYGIYRNADTAYGGMVGACQPEFNQCTEFVDRADTTKDYPMGRPYFFMRDSRLDTQSCNGKVSLKEGCVAIDDTSDGNKTIATLATYCKSDAGTDPLCDQILTNANVGADVRGKDGALVATVTGPQSLTKQEAGGFNCVVAREKGLFVANDCDAQLEKLKESADAVVSAGLSCGTPEERKAVADKIAVGRAECAPLADSNTVVKVRRDRTCSEWLACKSSISVFDKNTQKYKEVCTDLGVCNKLSSDSGTVGRCANWITEAQFTAEQELARSLPLTTDRYASRNVGWYGQEFSGYSLWNKFQPDRVGLFSRSNAVKNDQVMGVGFLSNQCNTASDDGDNCTARAFDNPAAKAQISQEFPGANTEGLCYEQKCWYPIAGFSKQQFAEQTDYTKTTCRGYPEADAPFSVEIISQANFFGLPTAKVAGYQQANVCDLNRNVRPSRNRSTWSSASDFAEIIGSNAVFSVPNGSCDCSYKKVKYGSTEDYRYFSLKSASLDDSYKKAGSGVLLRPTNGAKTWVPGTLIEFSESDNAFKVQSLKTNGGYVQGQSYSNVSFENIAFYVPAGNIAVGDEIIGSNPSTGIFSEITVLEDYTAIFPFIQEKESLSPEELKKIADTQKVYDTLTKTDYKKVNLDYFGTADLSAAIDSTSNRCAPEFFSIEGYSENSARPIKCVQEHYDAYCPASKRGNSSVANCTKASDMLSSLKKLLVKVEADLAKSATVNETLVLSYQKALAVIESQSFTKESKVSGDTLKKVVSKEVGALCSPTAISGATETAYSLSCIKWYFDRHCAAGNAPKANSGASVADCGTAYNLYSSELPALKENILAELERTGAETSPLPIDFSRVALTARQIELLKAAGNVTEATPEQTPNGVCSSGWFVEGDKQADKPSVHSKKGMSCSTDLDCIDERVVKYSKSIGKDSDIDSWQYSNDDGKCEFKTEETTVLGWEGYCLEEDFRTHLENSPLRRACLTWLPIDATSLDVYNQYADAAYSVGADGTGRYYCSESTGRMKKNSIKNFYGYTASEGASGNLSFKFPKFDGNNAEYDKYVNYSTAGLPTGFNANEIDYIELGSTGNSGFLPEGYKLRIVADGRVRVYAASGNKCMTTSYNRSTGKNELIDFLDPASWSGIQREDHFADVLSILSQQVRCKEGDTASCANAYIANPTSPEKPTEEHFLCYPGGETKMKDVLVGSVLGLTGVAKAGTIQSVQSGNKINRIPQITDKTYSQIWYVRLDNLNQRISQAYGSGGSSYGTEVDDAFKIEDIIRGPNAVNPGTQTGKSFDGCYLDDKATLNGSKVAGYTLRFLFDKDGKFAGVDSAGCYLNPDVAFEQNWVATVHFRDMCREVVQVVDANGGNKAATNALWQDYPKNSAYEKAPSLGVDAKGVTVGGGLIGNASRFGSFALNREPDELMYSYIEVNTRTGFNFMNAVGGKETRSFSCEGAPETCVTDKSGFKALNASVTKNQGETALKQLFGKVYKTFELNSSGDKYAVDSGVLDSSGEATSRAPAIFALDPTTCTGARGATCEMKKKYGFTVNGQYKDGSVVFGKGSVAATVQFYGYAHQDHMPIKKIRISWGDKSSDLDKTGMYRNHKAVCSTTTKPAAVCKFGNDIDYNHTCSTNKDCVNAGGVTGVCSNNVEDLKWSFGSWPGNGGSDEGACEEGYFQFTHAYTFTSNCGGTNPALVANAQNINEYKLEGMVGIDERFCVFKPKIQLQDNWGVCNGVGGGKSGAACGGFTSVNANAFTPFQGNIIVKE